MESRGVAVELIHNIVRVGNIALKDDALHLCAHTAIMRLFGASSDISAASDLALAAASTMWSEPAPQI